MKLRDLWGDGLRRRTDDGEANECEAATGHTVEGNGGTLKDKLFYVDSAEKPRWV